MSDNSAPEPEAPRTRRRKSLSPKQMAILEVIQSSISRHGYPPSMREIGDAVGLKSLSSVTHQLGQLELSGYLRRDPGKTRAMEVLIDLPGSSGENPADVATPVGDAALVPLVGRIAAGVASATQIAATVVLMLIVTVAMSAIAARIYQRSILRMGKTVSWREALAR